MSIFDSILGNLNGFAEKLGVPPEQLQSMIETAQSKFGEGGPDISSLMQAAQEHGFSLDSLQNAFGGSSIEDMFSKASGMLGGGEGGALDNLGGMVKGLFGKE